MKSELRSYMSKTSKLFNVLVMAETERAYLINYADKQNNCYILATWIPKSQAIRYEPINPKPAHIQSNAAASGWKFWDLEIPTWLGKKLLQKYTTDELSPYKHQILDVLGE